MQFGGEKRLKQMEDAIGICSLMVKGGETDEKCYRYMQRGAGKEAKAMESGIGICSSVLKNRQNR